MKFTWQHVVVIVVALVLVGTIGWFVMDGNGNAGPTKLWFYDLNTGELFPGKSREIPPIAAPSGDHKGAPAGVLASVIRIEGSAERKIAYLQSHTPEVKELIAAARENKNGPPADFTKIMAGTLVALPPAKPGEAIKWVTMNSPDGYKITMATEAIGGGKPYTTDLP